MRSNYRQKHSLQLSAATSNDSRSSSNKQQHQKQQHPSHCTMPGVQSNIPLLPDVLLHTSSPQVSLLLAFVLYVVTVDH